MRSNIFRITGVGTGQLLPVDEPAYPGEGFWNPATLRFGFGKGDRSIVWMLNGRVDGTGVGINIPRQPKAGLNLEIGGTLGFSSYGSEFSNLNLMNSSNMTTGFNVDTDRILATINNIPALGLYTDSIVNKLPVVAEKSVTVNDIVTAQDYIVSGYTRVLSEYKDAVHVSIYDTSRDSDGGAWRHRCSWQTWALEALNTAERGDSAKFPAIAIVVVRPKELIILDAETQNIRSWMSFEATHIKKYLGNSILRRATMLNGVLYVAAYGGLFVIDFIQDSAWVVMDAAISANSQRMDGPISNRNRFVERITLDSEYEGILSNDVKYTTAHIYQGTTVSKNGLPRATIDVVTSKGINRLLPNKRTVSLYSDATVANRQYSSLAINDQGDLFALNTYANQVEVYRAGNSFVDNTSPNYVYKIDNVTRPRIVGGAIDTNTRIHAYNDSIWLGWCDVSADPTLIEIREDRANESASMVWLQKKGYSSGWLAGDLKAAWLINSKTTDRSPFANSLSETGTVTENVRVNNNTYATGFTANDYLSRAYAASSGLFDFTDDWTIYFWRALTAHDASSATNTLFEYGKTDGTGAYMRLETYESAAKTWLRLSLYDGTVLKQTTFDASCDTGVWGMNALVRRGNSLEVYTNGNRVAVVDVSGLGGIVSSLGEFRIGRRVVAAPINPAANLSLSMFRIAKNALNPSNIAAIFNDELALQFDHDNRYWLPETQGGIWPTIVRDMDFDAETGSIAMAHDRGLWITTNHVVISSRTLDDNATYPNLNSKSVAVRDKLMVAATDGGIFVKSSPRVVKSSIDQAEHFKDNRTDDNIDITFVGGTSDGNWKIIGGVPVLENSILKYDVIVTALGYVPGDVDSAFFERSIFAYRRIAEDAVQPVKQAGREFRSDNRIDVDVVFENNNDTMLVKVKGIEGKQFRWKAVLRKHENI